MCCKWILVLLVSSQFLLLLFLLLAVTPFLALTLAHTFNLALATVFAIALVFALANFLALSIAVNIIYIYICLSHSSISPQTAHGVATLSATVCVNTSCLDRVSVRVPRVAGGHHVTYLTAAMSPRLPPRHKQDSVKTEECVP